MRRVITRLYDRADEPPPLPAPQLAQLLVALGAGARLEQAVDPESLPATLFAGLLARVLASRTSYPPSPALGRPKRRRQNTIPPIGAESHDDDHR
jgi:hypothetical protein